MKKIVLPILLMASTLAISCSTQAAPRKYSFYTFKEGVDSKTLQGTPWLNTSIVGMANKIERPEAKDDFFAYANYDTLTTNVIPEGSTKGGGTLYGVIDLMNQRVASVKNDSETYQAIKELVKVGAKDAVKSDAEKYFNMTLAEFKEYTASVEFLRGSSAIFTMTNTRGAPVLGLPVSENVSLYTSIVSSYMFGFDKEVPGMLCDIAEAEGFNRSAIEEKVNDCLETLVGYSFGAIMSETTQTKVKVSELSNVFNGALNLEKIVKDLGFQDNDEISYTPIVTFVNNTIESLIADETKFEQLKTIVALSKIFENRYLIGAENVKNLFVNKLVETGAKDKNITASLSIDDVADYLAQLLFNLVIDKEYSSQFITDRARERVHNLIDEVVAGFTTVLENSEWLSDATRAKALEKMEAMHFEAFYSDAYKEKAAFTYTSDNVLNCYDEYFDYFISGVIDSAFYTDALHVMPVTTVNAAYNPSSNSFRIYHGIVSDFIDNDELSTEELYGRIGTVIGHEITHGFDSTGAYYDKEGAVADWWTAEDRAVFESKINKMANYYNKKISVIKDTKLNGSNLTGEAIADMGGLKAVLEMAKKIENFDYDAFFKSNATFYDFSYTEEGIRVSIKEDPHPIGYLRINLTYAQFDKFFEVYDIKPGDGMYIAPKNRIAIW